MLPPNLLGNVLVKLESTTFILSLSNLAYAVRFLSDPLSVVLDG